MTDTAKEYEIGSEPPKPKEYDQLDAARAHIGRLGDQVATLIKERDDARSELRKSNEHADLLERTLAQMSSQLADAEVKELGVKLELAKERARTARMIARDADTPGRVDVFAFITKAKADEADDDNGKDA